MHTTKSEELDYVVRNLVANVITTCKSQYGYTHLQQRMAMLKVAIRVIRYLIVEARHIAKRNF